MEILTLLSNDLNEAIHQILDLQEITAKVGIPILFEETEVMRPCITDHNGIPITRIVVNISMRILPYGCFINFGTIYCLVLLINLRYIFWVRTHEDNCSNIYH